MDSARMLDGLAAPDRLLLLRFLCAYAWTDLEVSEPEKRFVRRMATRLAMGQAEAEEVEGWLHVAPAPGSVDPAQIPSSQRRLFLDAVRAMVYADGKVDSEERESLERLKAALGA